MEPFIMESADVSNSVRAHYILTIKLLSSRNILPGHQR